MRITAKGQITIPSEIREQLGFTPNSEVVLAVEGDTVRISRADPELSRGRTRCTPLSEDPFVGMWQDRKEMSDSSDWVRNYRKREWDPR